MSNNGSQPNCRKGRRFGRGKSAAPTITIRPLAPYGVPIQPSSMSLRQGLQARTEKRVGRAAHPQAALAGQGEHIVGVVARHREGLLGVGVLASTQDGAVHVGVRGGRRQVQHDLNLGVGQQLIDRAGQRNAILRRALARQLGHQVGAGHHLEDREHLRAVL